VSLSCSFSRPPAQPVAGPPSALVSPPVLPVAPRGAARELGVDGSRHRLGPAALWRDAAEAWAFERRPFDSRAASAGC
jgi:hypothetical protein